MPLLPNPDGLNNWLRNTDANFANANEAMANLSPAFEPSSGANFSTLRILSGELPQDALLLGDGLEPLSAFLQPSNQWENTLHTLRSAQRDMVVRHWLERTAVTGQMDAMIYGLSLVPRATPLEGTVIFGMTKILEGQRAMLEHGVLQRHAEKRASLARHAIRKLMQEDDMPYDALFPVGDPNRARENIQRAQDLLRGELEDLDPDMREEVLHGMVDAMASLVNSNPTAAGSETAEELQEPYDAEEAKQDAEAARLAIKAARVVLEQKKKDSAKVADAGVLLTKILTRIENGGDVRQSERERLRALGREITEATGAAQSVVAAAEALGLPADTAADLNKAVAITSNAAMLYVSFTTNPAQAITAAANLISLFAGRKRTDAAAVRHKAVMNALGKIFEQNQQIMENQRLIYDEIERLQEAVVAVQRNQAALFELGLATLDAVLLNRGLIVRVTSGPLALFEEAVAAYDDRQRREGASYQMLRNFFSGYTGDVSRGLRTLRDVLRSTADVHPSLLQNTYRDGARAEVRVEGRISFLEVASSADGSRRDEDERRYALCRGAWLRGGKNRDPRLLTEFGTYDSVLDERFGRLDLGLKHTWDGTLPASLLEFGLVWRFGVLALRSHMFHQFLSEISGMPALRPLEEIHHTPAETDLGKRLLEKALAHVDCALAQSYLMTGRFASVDFLSGLWTQEDDLAPRIMIELDRHVDPEPGVYEVRRLDLVTMGLWSLSVESEDISVDVTWIDRVEDIKPEFSDYRRVMAAVERMWGLRSQIDGFMYQLNNEDQVLVDEYFELGEQADAEHVLFRDAFFMKGGPVTSYLDNYYSDVEFILRKVESKVADLPVDLRAIAEGLGGLVSEGRLTIPREVFSESRTSSYARHTIEDYATHFTTLAKARRVGVDDPEVSDKVAEAMDSLSLYADLPADAFRGGTTELRDLRAALIAAIAEYDVSDRVLEERQVLNVVVALGSLNLEVEPIREA